MGKGIRPNKPKQKIKEYLYLDETEMNSILAQLENGIKTAITKTDEFADRTSKSDGRSKANEENGQVGMPGVANAQYKHQSSKSVNTTDESSTTSKNAIETVYNDYALDLLERKLKENNIITNIQQANDGRFIKINANLESILDFETIHDVLSLDSIMDILKTNDTFLNSDRTDVNSEIKNGFEAVKSLYKIFPNTTFLKVDNKSIFADNKNFRINKSQLQLISLSSRKITVLGKVEAKFSNENKSEAFDIAKMISSLYLNLLEPLGTKNGDQLIKPIAIYFND